MGKGRIVKNSSRDQKNNKGGGEREREESWGLRLGGTVHYPLTRLVFKRSREERKKGSRGGRGKRKVWFLKKGKKRGGIDRRRILC